MDENANIQQELTKKLTEYFECLKVQDKLLSHVKALRVQIDEIFGRLNVSESVKND